MFMLESGSVYIGIWECLYWDLVVSMQESGSV